VADFCNVSLAQIESRLQLYTDVPLPSTAEAHDFGAGIELFHMREETALVLHWEIAKLKLPGPGVVQLRF
jgi:hypothetical protein